MRRHTLCSLVIVACALSWGSIGIIVREVDLPALVIVFFRVLTSAATVALVLIALRRRELFRIPPGGRAVPLFGVLLATHWGLYFAAIQQTSVASAVLITYAAPIFMALLAPLVIGEHVPGVSWAALAVSGAGIALITLSGEGSGSGEVHLAGVLLALGAAVTYACLIVFVKHLLRRVEPLTVVLYESVFATLALSPFVAATSFSLDGAQVGYLLVLGVVLTGLAGIAYISALRFVAATTAGILAYIEPLGAAVLAALLLSERLTVGVVIGGALIISAGVAVILRTPDPIPTAIEEPVPVPAIESRS